MTGLLITLFAILVAIVVVQVVQARRMARSYPACGSCGYDVTGTLGASARCPECGMDFAKVGVLGAQQKIPIGRHYVIGSIAVAFIMILSLVILDAERAANSAQRRAAVQIQQQQQQQRLQQRLQQLKQDIEARSPASQEQPTTS